MCLEDVKIGRLTTGQLISRNLTVTPQLLIGSSPIRRVLILFPHEASDYRVTFDDETTSPSFVVPAGNPPIILNRDDFGDIVSRAVFGYAAAGAPTVTIYAANFPIEELKRAE